MIVSFAINAHTSAVGEAYFIIVDEKEKKADVFLTPALNLSVEFEEYGNAKNTEHEKAITEHWFKLKPGAKLNFNQVPIAQLDVIQKQILDTKQFKLIQG